MSKVEGRTKNFVHNATSFTEITTTGAVWQEVEFKDHNDMSFESGHVKITNTTNNQDADISFDPRDVTDIERTLHGIVERSTTLELLNKHATSIFVRMNVLSGGDSALQILAWR